MTPPRLLMTTDAVGGVWSYASDLAQALCGRGWSVVLVTMGPPPRAEQLAPSMGVRDLHVIVSDLALEWMDPSGSDLPHAHDTLLRIAERVQPHIIHLNGFREAGFEWPAPCIVVAHSCVWSWWEACRGGVPDARPWFAYRDNAAAGVAAADAWVAPSKAFLEQIAHIYRPGSDGIVINNGCASPAAFPRKKPQVLAAGRLWDEAKNLSMLERAAVSLRWPVRVAGPLEAPGHSASEPGALSVIPLGSLSRDRLADEMSDAGIFASLARYEPFGLTVLEAAARGCALVLSDIPTFRELWGDAAFFVAPDDEAAAIVSINRLSGQEDVRHAMQKRARARARRYSLRKQVNAYDALYRRLTFERRAARSSRSERQELHV